MARPTPQRARRYLMVGAPITTVRTPPLLQGWFAERGAPATIETRHVDAPDIGAFMATFRHDKTLDGLLVTMPHKGTVMTYLDQVSDEAHAAGGVNTVKRLPNGDVAGAQFDGEALTGALIARGIDLGQASVLQAGVGDAGLAIALALVAQCCRALTLVDTDADRLNLAAASFRAASSVTITNAMPGSHHDVLVNATPLGMRPGDASPFGEEQVAAARIVADIVADPPNTALAASARAAGTELITGRDMVAAQIGLIGAWLTNDGVAQA